MSNALSFVSIHKSITSFPDTGLPEFVVLTGRNGSGKTHLLNAIKAGKIRSSLVSNLVTDVRIFDSTTIIPTDTGAFDPSQEQTRRTQWFNVLQQQQDSYFPNLQLAVINLGIPPQYCSSIRAIQSLKGQKLVTALEDSTRAGEVEKAIGEHLKAAGAHVSQMSINHIGDEWWRTVAPKVQNASPEHFLQSSQHSFYGNEHFLWGEVDPFQQAFGRVFATYRELIHDNVLFERFPTKDDTGKVFLTDTEFLDKHGSAPWDFLNQILEECLLDFRADGPPLNERTSFEPKLRKVSTGIEMRFQDLSSGEKVLMSFALCLYNVQDKRQVKTFPTLLLLDEIDAPLHPSMTASLLKTIQNVLVRDKKVAVILTTHSPSTVALAPEDSIYAMNPVGPKIEKISKSEALSLLTAGVPTLSISFDGRRQIFVESRTDAHLYDLLYQRYKGQLNSERSLVFVEVGRKDGAGQEHNAGCAQVINLVSSLAAGGNQSVLGLVDWDGHSEASDRIHVLSPRIRDGLESLLLDPVLLIATVTRENRAFAEERSMLESNENYISVATWDNDRWQRAVNRVQDIVLSPNLSCGATIDVKYLNGMTVKISSAYLHLDDHELEARITEAFGFLRPKNRRAGELMRYVVETVLTELPMLLPEDLLVTFNGLLGCDLH
jgi:energy-coupling factor transporter ATP-binding protein EcfA2